MAFISEGTPGSDTMQDPREEIKTPGALPFEFGKGVDPFGRVTIFRTEFVSLPGATPSFSALILCLALSILFASSSMRIGVPKAPASPYSVLSSYVGACPPRAKIQALLLLIACSNAVD